MSYRLAIYLGKKATIRKADSGVTDFEWEHGCRSIPLDPGLESAARERVASLGYEILDATEWREFLDSMDSGDGVTSNRFVSTRYVKDKWDGFRPVY